VQPAASCGYPDFGGYRPPFTAGVGSPCSTRRDQYVGAAAGAQQPLADLDQSISLESVPQYVLFLAIAAFSAPHWQLAAGDGSMEVAIRHDLWESRRCDSATQRVPINQSLADPLATKLAAGYSSLENPKGLVRLHGLAEKEPITQWVQHVATPFTSYSNLAY
jgi:hypothetical protein